MRRLSFVVQVFGSAYGAAYSSAALGHTTAATRNGFAIGSAVLTSLSLLVAFKAMVGASLEFDVSDSVLLSGILFNALLRYLFSALTRISVGKAAAKIIGEARRQFREQVHPKDGRTLTEAIVIFSPAETIPEDEGALRPDRSSRPCRGPAPPSSSWAPWRKSLSFSVVNAFAMALAGRTVQGFRQGDNASGGSHHYARMSDEANCIHATGAKLGVQACAEGWPRVDTESEDEYVTKCSESKCVFGVFDGHGSYSLNRQGTRKRSLGFYLKDRFVELLSTQDNVTCPEVMKAKIATIAREFRDEDIGSTGTGFFINLDVGELLSFNVGDSRTIVWKAGDDKSKPVLETVDHDSSLPEEKKWVEDHGGSTEWNGFDYLTCNANTKTEKCLTSSRSFGDKALKSPALIVRDEADMIRQTFDVHQTPGAAPAQIRDGSFYFIVGSDGILRSVIEDHRYHAFEPRPNYAFHRGKYVNRALTKRVNRWLLKDKTRFGEVAGKLVNLGLRSRKHDPAYRHTRHKRHDTTAIVGEIWSVEPAAQA